MQCTIPEMKSKATRVFIIFLFSTIFSCVFPTVSRGEDSTKQIISARGDRAYPPFEFINEKGEPDGFNVELFKAIMKELDLEYNLQLIRWEEAMKLLKENKIDAITGMAYSPSRARIYNFSSPHSYLYQNMICRRDHPVNSLEALENKEVILQNFEISTDIILSSGINCNIILTDNIYEGLKLLSEGKHDAAICGDIIAKYIIGKYKFKNLEIRYLPSIKPVNYGFATNINNPRLRTMLNIGMEKLKENGTYSRIYNKWFSDDRKQDISSPVYIIIAVLAAIILISFITIYIIRRHIRNVTGELNALNEDMSETLLRTHLAMKKSNLIQWDYDCRKRTLRTLDNFISVTADFKSEKDYFKNIHPNDFHKISSVLERMNRREDFEYTIDIRMKYPDKKEWQYVSIDGVPVKDKKGKIIKYTGFRRNNTNFVKLNEQIKEKNLHLNLALQAGYIIPMIIDTETDTVYISMREHSRTTNITSSGKPISTMMSNVHPDDRERIIKIFHDLKNGLIRKAGDEIRYYSDDRNENHFELNYIGTNFDQQGKPGKIVGYSQNITERKKAGLALKQQKEFISNILNLLPFPVHIKDVDNNGTYIYWNRESEKFLGNFLSQSATNLLESGTANAISEIDREVYDSGKPYINQETLITKDGKELSTIVHKNVIHYGNKKLLLVVRWDIGEQKELYRKSKILSTSMQALKAYTWYCDLRDGILKFGEGFDQTGGSAEEMNSIIKFARKIHPAYRQNFIDFMDDFCKRDCGDFALEYEIDYTGNGNYEWWECRGVMDIETSNNISYKYIYGIYINISRHKEVELDLLRTKSKLDRLNKQNELILNNTNSGLVFLDNNYVIQWENLSSYLPTHPILSKYKKGAVCHNSVKELETPCPDCLVEKSRRSLKMEFREMTLCGITAELTSVPVFNEDNILIGSVLKIVNITDKRKIILELERAKNSAEKTNRLMQNIYDRLPCMLFIKDVTDDYRYIVANSYFCKALGKPGNMIIGKTDFEIFSRNEAERFRADDTIATGMKEPHIFEEDTYWLGKHTVWQTTKSVMEAINGHKIIIGLSLDVTDKIESYKELEEAKEKAEQSNKLKSAFLANMSHEIRTPLNAIVGFSNLIAYSDNNEEKREYYNIININNELLLHLIGDILDLSKIEAGMLELKPEQFNVEELFVSLKYTFARRVKSSDVKLICETPGKDTFVYLDKNRFTQVITNFANNAVKFTPKGEIRIGYIHENEGVRIYVSDTGIGIAPDKIGKVFERFEKLDDFAQGTGLGMAICKAITDASGGTIGVESKFGYGSTFWAWFPLT